jgi:hypothetical protein
MPGISLDRRLRQVRGFDRDRRALPQLVAAACQGGGLGGVACQLERHVEVGDLDGPEAAEVLLVPDVGGSWPYGG